MYTSLCRRIHSIIVAGKDVFYRMGGAYLCYRINEVFRRLGGTYLCYRYRRIGGFFKRLLVNIFITIGTNTNPFHFLQLRVFTKFIDEILLEKI
jgi:hypothetical protein